MIYKTKKLEFTTVIICEKDDGTTISFGESLDNIDYRAYLEWLAEGNTPLPADEVTQ